MLFFQIPVKLFIAVVVSLWRKLCVLSSGIWHSPEGAGHRPCDDGWRLGVMCRARQAHHGCLSIPVLWTLQAWTSAFKWVSRQHNTILSQFCDFFRLGSTLPSVYPQPNAVCHTVRGGGGDCSGFHDPGFTQKGIKMVLRCILSVIFQLLGFKL